MKNKTDLMPNVESKPALGSDWVDANADYLFNFAIGQVRDAVMLHRARKQLREQLGGWWFGEPTQKASDGRLNL